MREVDLSKAELLKDPCHLSENVLQRSMGVIEELAEAVTGDNHPVSGLAGGLLDRWIPVVLTSFLRQTNTSPSEASEFDGTLGGTRFVLLVNPSNSRPT